MFSQLGWVGRWLAWLAFRATQLPGQVRSQVQLGNEGIITPLLLPLLSIRRKRANLNTMKLHRKIILIGIALILCLPVLILAGSIYCYLMPKSYQSAAVVGTETPESDVVLRGAGEMNAVETAFRKVALQEGPSAQIQHIRNTLLHQIIVTDHNPKVAADRANALATKLMEEFKRTSPSKIKMWARAEPATAPGAPNIIAVQVLACGIGAILALVGVVILIVTFLRREKVVTQ